MSFKKVKVVMLPTNEKAGKISMGNTSLKLDYHIFPMEKGGIYTNHTYQHLYFLSDEEIKEGDWFIGFADGSISPFVRQADKSTVEINNWQINKKGTSSNKKIIATTDSNLTIKTLLFVQGENKEIDVLLPEPSTSFIEKFVEEYNKGNVITEVMVEYEYDSYSTKTDGELTADFKLKINPRDNTITIRKVKDSWNREEVEEKIREGAYVILNGSIGDFDKWIEENL